MNTCIVNAKVDSYTKERVDEVLSQHGKTASDAIRSLWQYLSVARDLPDFMKDKDDQQNQERRSAIKALLDLAGSVSIATSEADLDYRELLADSMEDRHGE